MNIAELSLDELRDPDFVISVKFSNGNDNSGSLCWFDILCYSLLNPHIMLLILILCI